MARPISEFDDVIDSRDVIERIEELEGADEVEPFDQDDDGAVELRALRELADQGEVFLSDWQHGETLIRDSYFTEYAQQLAEDIGAIDPNAAWPLSHIDWEAAAEALLIDYTEISFRGVTYWGRA